MHRRHIQMQVACVPLGFSPQLRKNPNQQFGFNNAMQYKRLNVERLFGSAVGNWQFAMWHRAYGPGFCVVVSVKLMNVAGELHDTSIDALVRRLWVIRCVFSATRTGSSAWKLRCRSACQPSFFSSEARLRDLQPGIGASGKVR